MALIEIGRVCIKKFGRDAGERAVITKVVDDGFVEIMTASRPKARKCNVRHIELLAEKIDVGSKEQLAKAIEIEPSKLAAHPHTKKA